MRDTYKRIFPINDSKIAAAFAAEAYSFRVRFRKARSGGPNEYVIEGLASRKSDIDTIVDNLIDMDTLASQAAAEYFNRVDVASQ